jgi:hypothetical protein
MRGDAVSTGSFGLQCRCQGTGMHTTTRIPDRGDMININTKSQFSGVRSCHILCLSVMFCMKERD